MRKIEDYKTLLENFDFLEKEEFRFALDKEALIKRIRSLEIYFSELHIKNAFISLWDILKKIIIDQAKSEIIEDFIDWLDKNTGIENDSRLRIKKACFAVKDLRNDYEHNSKSPDSVYLDITWAIKNLWVILTRLLRKNNNYTFKDIYNNEEFKSNDPLIKKTINIKKKSVLSVFKYSKNKKEFKIPIYQRRYEWNHEDLDVLWNDIQKVCDNRGEHYFGTIAWKISQKENAEIIQIIDGQQRLTTSFLIFLAYINILKDRKSFDKKIDDKSNDVLKLAKTMNYNYDNVFINPGQTHNLNETFKKISKFELKNITDDKKNSYYMNFLYLKKLMNDSFNDEDELTEFVNRFFTNFNLGITEFEDISVKEELEIFNSLNSKGRPLSFSDLIKNTILSFNKKEILSEYEKELEKYFNIFTAKFENETDKTKDIDEFYKTLINYCTGEEASSHNNKNYILMEEVYKILFNINVKNKEEIKSLNEFEKLTTKLGNYAEIFYSLKNLDNKNKHQPYYKFFELTNTKEIYSLLPKTKKMYLVNLNYFIFDYALKNWKINLLGNDDERLKLKKYEPQLKLIKEIVFLVIKIINKNYLITGQGDSSIKREIIFAISKLRQDYFPKNLKEIKQFLIDTFKDKFEKKKSRDEFLIEVRDRNKKPDEVTKSVLKMCEITYNYDAFFGPGNNGNSFMNLDSVEHIIPQNLDKKNIENWKQDIPNYEDLHLVWCNRWGNYLIIKKEFNAQLKNKNFVEKKKLYDQKIELQFLYRNKDKSINMSNRESFLINEIEARNEAISKYIAYELFKEI